MIAPAVELTKNEIVQILYSGLCKFTYTKENGEIRNACGTLQAGYIPEDLIPKKDHSPRISEKSRVRYFDTDVQGWRSFRIDYLNEIELCISSNLPC